MSNSLKAVVCSPFITESLFLLTFYRPGVVAGLHDSASESARVSRYCLEETGHS